MKQEQDIELAIDKIVLHGFSTKSSKGLKGAVEFELNRIIRERGLPSEVRLGGNFEELPGGKFNVKAGSSLKTLATQISNHVYNGFSEPKVKS